MTQEAQAPAKKGCDGPGFILILVLTGFMFLYHQFFYAPQLEKYKQDLKQWEADQKKKADEEAAAAEAAAVKSATVAGPGSSTTAQPGSKTVVQPTPKGVAKKKKTDHPRKDGIAFTTPEHAVKLSTAGASLTALTFTRANDPAVLETTYAPKQSKEKDARKAGPFTPLHHYLDDVRSLAITPVAEDLAWVATADWDYAPGPDGSHVFSLTLPNGLILKKIYEPPVSQPSDDKAEKVELFHFRLRIQIENPTGTEQKFGYYLNGPAGMVEQEVGRAGGGQYAVMASLDKNKKIDDIMSDAVSGMDTLKAPSESLKPEEASTKIAFFGLTTKYFCAVVAPLEETEVASAEAFGLLPYTGKTPDDASKEHPDGLGNQGLVRGLVKEVTIKPNGGKVEQRFMVYVGPRQQTSIFQQPIYSKQHFGELVYYGWFGTRSIGRLLGWVLGGLFSLVGNLGFAILFLTFLVRGLMLPLSMYSQRNMLRMQKIGPELNALKEKFAKPDGSMTPEQQRAFAAAQMDMFRKHNVNPVGCIGPIFLQMPIFIGLYNALNYSSWLRHQPFIGWITDLSIPDVLWRMPVTIPLLGTNALSVLPLLMIATYLLQMKVQPKPSDPKMAEQQKMMKWMYPVFGFILYTMPSGLMLYFITSSLWGIAEQKVIKSRIEEQEGGGSKPDAKKSDLPGLAKTDKAAEPVKADVNSGGGGGGGGKKNKNKNKKKKR